jgi:hypothetical protein
MFQTALLNVKIKYDMITVQQKLNFEFLICMSDFNKEVMSTKLKCVQWVHF